ncbi:MAG: 4Fe-4S dicluster domain-containing protein [Chromatiaceae bacterium]|nr:4Fe-4S dicluster domain-containing protein [Chromatiaceae bacterium]MCP5312860.1 4Fe-4S dicluster domain-containing protein [Chromatiaceae bacterium]
MSQPTDQSPNKGRRDFLTGATGVAAATAVAPGVFLQSVANAAPRATAVTDDVRYGMLIDTTKCADGCKDCVDACDKENGLDMIGKPEGADDAVWEMQRPRWIRQVKLQNNLTGRVTTLPMMCQHCEKPPCVDVCPTGASFRRADGIVMVDRHTCIGCRYCMMACPYNARTFIHESVELKPTVAPRGKGCVESCNFCVQRRDNGGTTTACQDACQHGAIVFGDLKDPNSAVSQALAKYPNVEIRADLKLNTGVRYTDV